MREHLSQPPKTPGSRSVVFSAFGPARPPVLDIEEEAEPTRNLRLIAGLNAASGLIGFGVMVFGLAASAWLASGPRLGPSSGVLGSELGVASAAGFIGSGLALLLLRPLRRSGRRKAAIRILAVLVAGIGVARLIGSASFAPDLWLDDWSITPGAIRRLAPNAALNFTLLGGALWLMASSRARRQSAAQILVIASILISLLAIIGYAYRLAEVSGVARLIPMDLASASTFATLAIGLMLARPDRGLMAVVTGPGPGGTMFRRLLPTGLIVPIALGWFRLMGERMSLFGLATGVALFAAANVAVFVALVWVNSASIDRMEGLRRAAHEKLRESEAFYHSLVEGLPQNILRKDRQGRFTFANRRFGETVNRPVEEILGATDFDLFPAALAEKYRVDDQRVMDQDLTYESVEEHVTPDGQTHYVQVIKSPLRDARGAIVGVQIIFYDVTERWRYEAKLREQNEQLLALADSERRACDELKQAQSRMVETAKLAGLGEMVAGVAHEINNPLSFVGNNVAVLQRDLAEVHGLVSMYRTCDPVLETHDPALASKIREYSEAIDVDYTLENSESLLGRTREGVRRIQRIVGDLRLFARLDEGDRNLVDLNEGIESTVNIVLGNAKKKDVTLDLDLEPLPKVSCYASKINQVIMNLVSNAIDACEQGGRVVVKSLAADGEVRIVVEDDGSGIEPAIREQIFNPFFTTKPVGVGTGLGLSISYGIVQDHGGTIEVESEPERGSKFIVHLPARASDRREPIHQAEPARAAGLVGEVGS